MDYSQPDFYRFGEDSLFLANIFKSFEILDHAQKIHMLDLCCGCGVIGLEILKDNQDVCLSSLDLQEEYKNHFIQNTKLLNLENASPQFINAPFDDLKTILFEEKFDYIVSNPPYYNPNKGRLPLNIKKQISKFFIVDNFKNYLETVHHSLKKEGVFWLSKTTKNNNDVTDLKEIFSLFKQTDTFSGNGFELLRLMKLNKN